MITAEFKPTNPAREWPQTHILDRAANVIGNRMSNLYFISSFSCFVDKQFATLNQQNAKYCPLDCYITLNVPAGFDPQGIIITEQNQRTTS